MRKLDRLKVMVDGESKCCNRLQSSSKVAKVLRSLSCRRRHEERLRRDGHRSRFLDANPVVPGCRDRCAHRGRFRPRGARPDGRQASSSRRRSSVRDIPFPSPQQERFLRQPRKDQRLLLSCGLLACQGEQECRASLMRRPVVNACQKGKGFQIHAGWP